MCKNSVLSKASKWWTLTKNSLRCSKWDVLPHRMQPQRVNGTWPSHVSWLHHLSPFHRSSTPINHSFYRWWLIRILLWLATLLPFVFQQPYNSLELLAWQTHILDAQDDLKSRYLFSVLRTVIWSIVPVVLSKSPPIMHPEPVGIQRTLIWETQLPVFSRLVWKDIFWILSLSARKLARF